MHMRQRREQGTDERRPLRRAPDRSGPGAVLSLQRRAGNAAVCALLGRVERPRVQRTGDGAAAEVTAQRDDDDALDATEKQSGPQSLSPWSLSPLDWFDWERRRRKEEEIKKYGRERTDSERRLDEMLKEAGKSGPSTGDTSGAGKAPPPDLGGPKEKKKPITTPEGVAKEVGPKGVNKGLKWLFEKLKIPVVPKVRKDGVGLEYEKRF